MRILANWVLSALGLIIVAHVISGFEVRSFMAALLAALVIGFMNATLGALLKILTFPFTILTLGVFWFIINAIMLEIASAFVPGFTIHGFIPAFLGAIVLSLVNMVLRFIARSVTSKQE
jgi:putative membrane protein